MIDPHDIEVMKVSRGEEQTFTLVLPSQYAGGQRYIPLLSNDGEQAKISRDALVAWLREIGVCE